MLINVLERCISAANINLAKYEYSLLNWCIPAFKCISLIGDDRASLQPHGAHDRSRSSLYVVCHAIIFNAFLDRHLSIKIYFVLFLGPPLIVFQLKNDLQSGYIS